MNDRDPTDTSDAALPVETPEPGTILATDLKVAEYCPRCGRVLEAFRCKLVCECGYFMSCSEF